MKQHGPWKIKSSEVKYKNSWVEVREDAVIRPDGADGNYTVINMKAGASVLPIDDAGNVYLVSEFRYGLGRESVEAAGGAVDDGEEPLTTAKRELEEELGIIAQEWVHLGFVDPFTGMFNSPADLYLARNLSFVSAQQEGTETIKALKIPFAQAAQMVLDSKITHAQSCVLILKAAQYLGK